MTNVKTLQVMTRHLESLGLIVTDETFGFIPKFVKHQQIHPHEAKSKFSEKIKKTLINKYEKCKLHMSVTLHDKCQSEPSEPSDAGACKHGPRPRGRSIPPHQTPGLPRFPQPWACDAVCRRR